MVSVTSARPSGGREVVPAKTTSSILPPRSDLAPCSPMTQERASTTLDLPEPFGPTTQVMPGSRRSVVAEAKDLRPRRVSFFSYAAPLPSPLPCLCCPVAPVLFAPAALTEFPDPYPPALTETRNCAGRPPP